MAKRRRSTTQVGHNMGGYFGTGASPVAGKHRKRQAARTHTGRRI